MPNSIWNIYQQIEELDYDSKCRSILSSLQVIIKEIQPKDDNEYNYFKENLEYLKTSNEIKIYDIIEENGKIYVAIDANSEISEQFNLLIYKEEIIRKEGNVKNTNLPISKKELINLFKMEKAICKINYLNPQNYEGTGTGFFCEIDNKSIPIKKALFTNYHVLNESNSKEIVNFDIINTVITDQKYIIEYKGKEIKVNDGRKKIYNKDLDYTCIEIYDTDDITDFFQIDYQFLNSSKIKCLKKEIIILQYPLGKELSFSMGKILDIKIQDKSYDVIKHNASTKSGSSGSPIIRRSDENNKIIGIHYGSKFFQMDLNKQEDNAFFNIANFFDLILDDIISQIKEKYQNYNFTINHSLSIDNINNIYDIANNDSILVSASGIKNSEFSKYNNIIYFNEDNTNRDLIYRISSDFEEKTNGTYFLSTNLLSLISLGKDIMNSKNHGKIIFNLILGDINSSTGYFLSKYGYIKENIQNICIYSEKTRNNLKDFQVNYPQSKADILKEIVDNLKDSQSKVDILKVIENNLKDFQSKVDGHIYNNKEEVIEFIKSNHSEKLKPFPIIKVKTYKDYIDHYREMHSKISFFYNNLYSYLYYENFQKIKDLINEETEKDKERLLKSFKVFEIKNNKEKMDSLILKEYGKKIFFSFINKNIKKKNLNDSIIYFTSRFMETLNSYANRKNKYFHGNEIFIGKDLPFSLILQFEKKKGEIIFFSDFKIATETFFEAERTAIRFMPKLNYNKKALFSVLFTIENKNNKNNITNGIIIDGGFGEEQIILLPFSFYLVKDVHIDYDNFTCDIILENIGKNEILEEKIKLGDSIIYNSEQKIMEIDKLN